MCADLFSRRPKGVQAFLAKYVAEKRHEARTALGMPSVEAEVLDRQAVTNGAGREPGEDG